MPVGPLGPARPAEPELEAPDADPHADRNEMTITTRNGEVVSIDPDTFTPIDNQTPAREHAEREKGRLERRTMQSLVGLADQLGRHRSAERQLVNPTTGVPALDAIKEFSSQVMRTNNYYEEIDRAFAFPALEFARNVDVGRARRDVVQAAERHGDDPVATEKAFDEVVTSMQHGIDRGLDPREALSNAINDTGHFGGVGMLGSHSTTDNDAQGTGDLSEFGYYGFGDPRNAFNDHAPVSRPATGVHIPSPRPDVATHVPAPRPDLAPTHVPSFRPDLEPTHVPSFRPDTPLASTGSPSPIAAAWSGISRFGASVVDAVRAGFGYLAANGRDHREFGSLMEHRDFGMFGRPGQSFSEFRDERAANERSFADVARDAWDSVTDFAGDVGESISDFAGGAWDSIKDTFGFGDDKQTNKREDDDGTSADDARERSERSERSEPEGADRDGPGGKAV